jgi:hypothetical protein
MIVSGDFLIGVREAAARRRECGRCIYFIFIYLSCSQPSAWCAALAVLLAVVVVVVVVVGKFPPTFSFVVIIVHVVSSDGKKLIVMFHLTTSAAIAFLPNVIK